MRPRKLRYVDPNRRRGILYRAFAAFVATRVGRIISVNVAWKLDPVLLRWTAGRLRSGFMLPTALLETRGAKSGALRRNAVVYFHDDERVTIIASKLGGGKHPAWYHNLRAHPDVTFGGIAMRATIVDDSAERDRLWQLADKVFPAFERYRRDAARAGREIPIVQLIERAELT